MKALLLVWVIVAVAAGCGESASDPGGSDSDGAEVRSVRVHRGGGLVGASDTYEITRHSAGADKVFAAAEEVLAVPKRDLVGGLPEQPPCCDLFAYAVTITTDEGSTKFTTYDTFMTPEVEELVGAVLTAGSGSTG